MAKGQFTAEQKAHLDTYLPEYIEKLDAGVRGADLSRWKQSTATKALASPAFSNLNVSKYTRTQWFAMIVRKYTNYLHQVYLKEHPESASAPSGLIKANLLLKAITILTGRQLFARNMHGAILAASKQRVLDKGTNEVGIYQVVLKEMWDSLSSEEKSDWDEKAEDEWGDITANQAEFSTNIHQALRGLCQGGVVGDAEMVLFYAFRETETGDLLAGTQTNFGGDELGTAYGVPWSQFAESVIPRPLVHGGISPVTVNEDGNMIFPSIDIDSTPTILNSVGGLANRNSEGDKSAVPIPWGEIGSEPSKFYDADKFVFPLALKDPEKFTSLETLTIGEFLNSINSSPAFHFKASVDVSSDEPLPDAHPPTPSPRSPSLRSQSTTPPPPNPLHDLRPVSKSPLPIPPPPSSQIRTRADKRARDRDEDMEEPVPEKRTRGKKKASKRKSTGNGGTKSKWKGYAMIQKNVAPAAQSRYEQAGYPHYYHIYFTYVASMA
ncbi:hypothetical protein C8R44DRAFT_904781 [Mycena epipterygia]|nr:hypothetical protein C8R44DRAFT_904781 [Mycena epipterygia]